MKFLLKIKTHWVDLDRGGNTKIAGDGCKYPLAIKRVVSTDRRLFPIVLVSQFLFQFENNVDVVTVNWVPENGSVIWILSRITIQLRTHFRLHLSSLKLIIWFESVNITNVNYNIHYSISQINQNECSEKNIHRPEIHEKRISRRQNLNETCFLSFSFFPGHFYFTDRRSTWTAFHYTENIFFFGWISAL